VADGENSHKSLMTEVARAFKEGDMRPLLEAIDDDVVWVETAPPEFFRFGGTRLKRAGVIEAEAHIFANYLFRRFDPIDIVAMGDVVWGLFRVEALHRPTGKVVKTDYASRWRMRDGKIVEHQGLFDSATVLMQQGDIAAPKRQS
jgi:ketosteroid isomerase-like protein